MTSRSKAASISTDLVYAAVRFKLAAYGYSCQEPLPADRSIICVGNHACSLDSWIAFDVTRRVLQRRFLHIGEAAVLARFPILRRVGVLPVSATDPMLTMRSLSAAGRAARTDPGVAVWLFPTGDHMPSGSDIGTIKPGLQALARLAGESLVVPVGIHYYAYRQPRLAAWVHLGTPLGSARDIARAKWQAVADDTSAALATVLHQASAQVLAQATSS